MLLVVTSVPKSHILRNEYYPFGLSIANSWTRENTTGDNFLYNGGTELNTTTQVYDLHYRNYDPVLGRMNQVDPMASAYASATPYNYAFNSPTVMNDPLGDDPKDPKNSPKPTGAGGNANGGCSWCSPQDTGNGMGGFGNGSQLFSRSNAFFNPGWQPGSGSLSTYGGMTGAQFSQWADKFQSKSDRLFFQSSYAAATNTPYAQASFVMTDANGHSMGYNGLLSLTGKLLYLNRDNNVVQRASGGWVSVGSTTMIDLVDNTSFNFGGTVSGGFSFSNFSGFAGFEGAFTLGFNVVKLRKCRLKVVIFMA